MTSNAFQPNIEKNVKTDSNATIVYFSLATHKQKTLRLDINKEKPEMK